VGLPILTESAPVDAVDVHQTFVLDGQLEVVANECTCLSWAGARDNDGPLRESTPWSVSALTTTASAVSATALLLVVRAA